MKLILIGMVLAFLGGSTNYPLWYNINFPPYGNILVVGYVALTAYAIAKYQFLDIKVIATGILTVSAWLLIFIQFFIGGQPVSNQVLTGVTLVFLTIFGWMLYKAVKGDVAVGKELNLASHKLAGLNTKLEELDKAKSEFISIASHQLRTPLTSVKGFASLILENTFGKIPAPQKEAVEKIFVNNEKLCLLVEDMLNASRLEAGRLEYELEEADIVSAVKSTINVVSLYAKSKRLKLVARYPKQKELRAIIDQRKVSEIVSNLIDNAIKYTPKGSVTVTLEKFKKAIKVGKMENTGTIKGDWARVSVTDTGIGMNEKQTEAIFNKFKEGGEEEEIETLPASLLEKEMEKAKNRKGNGNGNGNGNNMSSGTGLGVYISRQMAQAMGGKLYATSPGKGKGSTFVLELPLVKK